MCAQRRLRSAWASAPSDQSLRCPHEEILCPNLPIERFAGHTLILLVLSCGNSNGCVKLFFFVCVFFCSFFFFFFVLFFFFFFAVCCLKKGFIIVSFIYTGKKTKNFTLFDERLCRICDICKISFMITNWTDVQVLIDKLQRKVLHWLRSYSCLSELCII